MEEIMEAILGKRIQEFEEYVDNVMGVCDAAGMAVSVFDKTDILYERYFGYRDAERLLPLDGNTIFGMASVSKSFTALSIMQLEDAGILSVEEPVKKYIPEFEDGRVRISHLLTHSAGYFPLKRILVKDVAEKLGIYEGGTRELGYDEALAEEGLKQVCARLNAQGKRLGEPGQYMSYSNDCYGLLAEIIHRTGGERSYGEYVQKHIFKPMGMERSFCEFIRPARDNNCTELYIHRGQEKRLENGAVRRTENAPGVREHSRDFYDNAFVLMGGGAIKSTVHDMRKYVRMYLMEGKLPEIEKENTSGLTGNRLVSRRAVWEMCRPRQEYHYGEWYGYGLAEKRIGGMTVWGHGGSLTGISNFIAWEPRLGIGVLVFCNTTGVPASVVAEKAFRMTAGMTLKEEPFAPVIPWSLELMKKATGAYLSGEGVTVELEEAWGQMGLKTGGERVNCRMILPGILKTEEPAGNDDLILMQDDTGDIFGVRFRGRILQRRE